ncbi:MAG: hypothetical protein P8Y91_04305 [Desulfuromonadales bacterium]|jgi:type II secretory pathway pseudopilin PulG
MKRHSDYLRSQSGLTLMVVLVMVVIIGLTLGIAGSTWKATMQRAKEKQLLWVGDQYRRAIESYFLMARSRTAGSRGPATYPTNLEDLVKDPRSVETVRHLRKIYKDPMTGDDFDVIRLGGVTTDQATNGTAVGPIIGVRSASQDEPFQKDGFPEEYSEFNNATRYSDWAFVFKPTAQQKQTPNQPSNQPARIPAHPSATGGVRTPASNPSPVSGGALNRPTSPGQ